MGETKKPRRYCKNKTAGKHRGSKWPEEIKTAAICDLLVSNNICAVARKYGVPESTLRTWMAAAEKTGKDGKENLFEEARKEAIRKLNHNASQAAVNSVEYIRRRLEVNDSNAERYEKDLADLEQQLKENRISAETAEAMSNVIRMRQPMQDTAAAGMLRALQQVSERSGNMLESTGSGTSIKITIDGLGQGAMM